jgi:hypothetical protein
MRACSRLTAEAQMDGIPASTRLPAVRTDASTDEPMPITAILKLPARHASMVRGWEASARMIRVSRPE